MERARLKLLPEMEGRTARWYARLRGTESQMQICRQQARALTAGLPAGAQVLEVAPGPGYLAIEIARLGGLRVTGVDVSRTFVALASEYAQQAGVEIEFRQGDIANLPFEAGAFDLIVCEAAFKNFARPVRALDEMHRVLRAGGTAIIQDLSRDASRADIATEVEQMRLGRVSACTTRFILGTVLRRRAYSPGQFANLVAKSAFQACEVRKDGIGLEVRLQKSPLTQAA